ncbi:MAG TPA: AraC family transcriptional regulator, partial [Chitinophagaceae bacterium]|nr:AraC family transcriptional regulator [Chitinophagaceae bacterium]
MKKNLLKEITPLTQNDCFTLFSRVKSGFDFPLHYHEEFELNFIRGAKGALRVVGDHMEEIDDLELVLTGPNLQHAWFNHQCRSKEIHEITIQFHRDLFDDKLLRRSQLSFIRNMFDKSARGILFPRDTIQALAQRIIGLNQKHGFDSVLELISILHDLSISRNLRILSDSVFTNEQLTYNSRRIEKTFDYMNKNFDKTITL